ncbi:MAG: flagellar motor stator protein MotA [Pseudomonadota bacterium]
MLSLIGMVVVLAMVFGGYMAAGGKVGIILEALPYELTMIGGAAVGAFLISNDMSIVKRSFRDVVSVIKGPRWREDDYRDLLCLLFALIKVGRRDPVALETHIEEPSSSPIFQAYPRIAADHESTHLICDTFRLMMMNYDDPHQLEDLLERELELHHEQALAGSGALQTMADGLPALGIVAAVLGVIKTMASIDQPPEVLGKMIGGALVGTFLGVFLAYGFVGPLAARIKQIVESEHRFYLLVRDTLVANLQKHSPQICVEVARQALSEPVRPSFDSLEEALKSAGEAAA